MREWWEHLLDLKVVREFTRPKGGDDILCRSNSSHRSQGGHFNNKTSSEKDAIMMPRQKTDALERFGRNITTPSKKLFCLTVNQTVSCDLFLNESFFSIYKIMHFIYIVIYWLTWSIKIKPISFVLHKFMLMSLSIITPIHS